MDADTASANAAKRVTGWSRGIFPFSSREKDRQSEEAYEADEMVRKLEEEMRKLGEAAKEAEEKAMRLEDENDLMIDEMNELREKMNCFILIVAVVTILLVITIICRC
jgi:predicted RNase H-like nuclease (RuvC/YqgF family)